MMRVGWVVLVAALAAGCGKKEEAGPRLADPSKSDPRLKVAGTGGGGGETPEPAKTGGNSEKLSGRKAE
jgi:hypothetical protein